MVLFKKRDGSHRFCVDYRVLNAVTTADSFPLPRIDGLLDQLGESEYFSTIDLAAGFWQIRMHPSAKEKTAFVTPQGLYEFRVMPFGLTNTPGVFQMQQVIMGLNPTSSTDFVSVYLDDILVFSRSLDDHLNHLRMVITRLIEVGLKLKPTKILLQTSAWGTSVPNSEPFESEQAKDPAVKELYEFLQSGKATGRHCQGP